MRLTSSVIILLSIIFLPYWVYLPILLTAVILLPFYIEAVFFGILIDTLYGFIGSGPALGYIFGLAAAIAVCVSIPLREQLRFNV